MSELFYERANVYVNNSTKDDEGNFTEQVSTKSSQPFDDLKHQTADPNLASLEFSSKMNNLEKILNSSQLGSNNLNIGPINNYTKIKENGAHLHHMYNTNANFENTLDAYISSKKMKNTDYSKYTEHYRIEQNVRKLVDSLSSPQKLPDLRTQARPQLQKEQTAPQKYKSEKQLPQQNIRFNSKQIKQFNSNSLHFTPNLIAGILGSGPISTKSVNPVNSLIHDVLTKANDSFFMPNIEKETAKNIHNISSSQNIKSRKRVIAFYHRVIISVFLISDEN